MNFARIVWAGTLTRTRRRSHRSTSGRRWSSWAATWTRRSRRSRTSELDYAQALLGW